MYNLKGRVAVVSGAASGLGKQMSRAFAEQGADLVLLDIQDEKLNNYAHELESEGVNVLALHCDVTNSDEINECVKKTVERFGKVDILLNNAGASRDNDVLNMTDDEWNFTINVDLTSVFKMTRAFANVMKEHNYGRIINIASMYGLVGNSEISTIAYHSSKGGVVNFTRACAADLAKYNITCNAICPGFFETELTKAVLDTKEFQAYTERTVPMKRYGHAGELNAGAVFLASDEASYVTGTILTIDGGYTCV